jgi:hypothetical protein
MPGMRSEEDILKAFEGLSTVPGSRHSRKVDTPTSVTRRKQVMGESNGWDEAPIKKVFKGKETELFTVGALAQALEKKIVTIRLWERKGYIPIAPFRLRSKSLNGERVNGNRVYTRELVEITIEEFVKRGLLGSARVEWNRHADLTETLVRRWKEIIDTL